MDRAEQLLLVVLALKARNGLQLKKKKRVATLVSQPKRVAYVYTS